MKYQNYPAYKDSGVEWLGDVPEHWDIIRLKNILECRITDGPHTTPIFEDEGIPFLSVDGIQDGELKFDGCRYISEASHFEYRKKALPKKDDLLMGKAASTGKIARVKVNFEFSIWSPLALIRLDCTVSNATFFEQSLKSPIAQAQIENLCTSNTQKNISMDDIPKLILTRPPLSEQQKIAQFLDHETAKIDTLIEKQQRLIELLKEKRQAVISHAVTKGLNPNAPMKDSGVEWLGEVPEHWIVKRLKHISPKIGVGLVINPSTYTRDEGVYFIFGGDVKEYEFDLSTTRRISEEDSNRLLPSRLNHRDLVCVRVGYPGITAVVTEELEGSNCASVIVIRRGDYNSDWLCAAINMWVGRQQVELASYGAAQKQFNVADVIEFIFPVPRKQEQNEIADYVEKTLVRFNTLSELASNQIELLQERRTALISAAVTGKIDVREWNAPNA